MHVGPGIERIGKKDEIELGALRGFRDPLDQREIFRTRLRVLQSPPGDVMPGAEDEQTKVHMATFCHAHLLNSIGWTDRGHMWDSGLGVRSMKLLEAILVVRKLLCWMLRPRNAQVLAEHMAGVVGAE